MTGATTTVQTSRMVLATSSVRGPDRPGQPERIAADQRVPVDDPGDQHDADDQFQDPEHPSEQRQRAAHSRIAPQERVKPVDDGGGDQQAERQRDERAMLADVRGNQVGHESHAASAVAAAWRSSATNIPPQTTASSGCPRQERPRRFWPSPRVMRGRCRRSAVAGRMLPPSASGRWRASSRRCRRRTPRPGESGGGATRPVRRARGGRPGESRPSRPAAPPRRCRATKLASCTAVVGELEQRPNQLVADHRVEAGERLVENHQLGTIGQRCQQEPPSSGCHATACAAASCAVSPRSALELACTTASSHVG